MLDQSLSVIPSPFPLENTVTASLVMVVPVAVLLNVYIVLLTLASCYLC